MSTYLTMSTYLMAVTEIKFSLNAYAPQTMMLIFCKNCCFDGRQVSVLKRMIGSEKACFC